MSKKASRDAVVVQVRPAGDDHQVVSVEHGGKSYRRTPCSDCPWRLDAKGVFPAEAFEHSADTAYDMSSRKFSCHQSGKKKPATCAGFLLKGADHNLAVRLGRIRGLYNDVTDGGNELHEDYVDMAVANGVNPESPSLRQCRRAREDY